MANVAITGAARGIGFELVRQHLEAGDRVFALVRDPDKADKLHQLASGSDNRLTVHAMDVTDQRSVTDGVAGTGGAPIDILYNVAGIPGVVGPEIESTDWDAFDEVIDVMLKGPLRVTQAFLPQLSSGSKVITFSSQLGASPWPYPGFQAYAAAKAGLNRLMRSFALAVKDRGIVVGLVHPGYVQTDMGGPNAEITPEESARGVRNVAENWKIEDTGEFRKWTGEAHAW